MSSGACNVPGCVHFQGRDRSRQLGWRHYNGCDRDRGARAFLARTDADRDDLLPPGGVQPPCQNPQRLIAALNSQGIHSGHQMLIYWKAPYETTQFDAQREAPYYLGAPTAGTSRASSEHCDIQSDLFTQIRVSSHFEDSRELY
jgi:hypothetical protein